MRLASGKAMWTGVGAQVNAIGPHPPAFGDPLYSSLPPRSIRNVIAVSRAIPRAMLAQVDPAEE
ncbi:MAG TPA: hypothetical protein VGC36_15805 [Rhizomicrobium sp.]